MEKFSQLDRLRESLDRQLPIYGPDNPAVKSLIGQIAYMEHMERARLPEAPVREAFATNEEFEEALGGWRERAGRIKGIRGVKPRQEG